MAITVDSAFADIVSAEVSIGSHFIPVSDLLPGPAEKDIKLTLQDLWDEAYKQGADSVEV